MSGVVTCIHPSVHAAYQHSEDVISVSVTSVYNKLNGIEIGTSAGLVRYAAGELAPVIKELGGAQAPGFRVIELNCSTETASKQVNIASGN